MLKKLPWVTIIVAGFVFLKFGPKILDFLNSKAPSIAKAVQPQGSSTANDSVV